MMAGPERRGGLPRAVDDTLTRGLFDVIGEPRDGRDPEYAREARVTRYE